MASARRAIATSGFMLPAKVRTIREEFNDGQYAGAIVSVRESIPIGLYFRFSDLMREEPEAAFRLFGQRVLISWNLIYNDAADEDKVGKPIPATADGILDVEEEFLTVLFRLWRTGVEEVPAPLVEP